MDLPAIAARYRRRIASARTDAEQRDIFDAFMSEFRDPHLRIDWEQAAVAARPACRAEAPAAGLTWERAPGFRPFEQPEERPFGPGTIEVAGTLNAVIRFPDFDPRSYPACRDAARHLSIDPDGACERECADRLDRAAGRLLSEALDRTLRHAASVGAQRVIVDLVDNEGGSDWVESALRRIAGPVASPRIGMLRHPAWVAYLTSLSARLPFSRDKPARMVAVRVARDRLRQRCDLSAAWLDPDLAMGRKPLPCTSLVTDLLSSSGIDATVSARSTPATMVAMRYGPVAGSVHLPVLVLVNDNTHSAAELFAASVQDNEAGQIAGIVTPGAGCGTFTDRGTGFVLARSGARVSVPDCTRLRRDGTNERRGITPDIFIPWGLNDSGWMRLEKALRVIAGVPLRPARRS